MRGRGRDLPSATASGSPDKSPTVEDAATRSKRKQKYWTPGGKRGGTEDTGKRDAGKKATAVPFRVGLQCGAHVVRARRTP